MYKSELGPWNIGGRWKREQNAVVNAEMKWLYIFFYFFFLWYEIGTLSAMGDERGTMLSRRDFVATCANFRIISHLIFYSLVVRVLDMKDIFGCGRCLIYSRCVAATLGGGMMKYNTRPPFIFLRLQLFWVTNISHSNSSCFSLVNWVGGWGDFAWLAPRTSCLEFSVLTRSVFVLRNVD